MRSCSARPLLSASRAGQAFQKSVEGGSEKYNRKKYPAFISRPSLNRDSVPVSSLSLGPLQLIPFTCDLDEQFLVLLLTKTPCDLYEAISTSAVRSSWTTGLTDLPAELIQIILELSVDPDYLAQEKDPKRCLRVRLAPIHILSRLRAVALSFQSLWRISAASIPPVISHKTFFHIIELCSKMSGNSLERVNFRLSQSPRDEGIDWLCDWKDIEKSVKSISVSTSSLQAIRFVSIISNVCQC